MQKKTNELGVSIPTHLAAHGAISLLKMLTPERCDVELTKDEFDDLAISGSFNEGPLAEEPSKKYGASYIARKHFRVFGVLNDGRRVWAWRYPEERDKEL